MNFFSHAHRFLGDGPHFLAGLAIPDWLTMVDRSVRIRRGRAADWVAHSDPDFASVARGIVQHVDDDRWFHETEAFAQTHIEFTQQIARLAGNDSRFRPYFVAHVTIEMLLDAVLTENAPEQLAEYYGLIASLDGSKIERIVNRMATRTTANLALFLPRYVQEAFVFDYLRDDGLAYRLNRILRRLGMSELPPTFTEWLAEARGIVRERNRALLTPPAGMTAASDVTSSELHSR